MYRMDLEREGLAVTLEDGRYIGYALFGNKSGFPLFYFHGFPGSRFEAKLFDEELRDSPFQLIAIDRPGIGLSSIHYKRRLLDWPQDIEEFSRLQGIDKFGILGVSGGGPYALSCAYKLPPKHLEGVIIASGMGPLEGGKNHMNFVLRTGLTIARKHPTGLRNLLQVARILHSSPKRAHYTIYNFIQSLPASDRKLFKEYPDFLPYFVADNYYAYIQGIEGLAQDAEIYARSWGFELSKIPNTIDVHIIHGKLDTIVPFEMAQYMAGQIPNCKLHVSDRAHFSAIEDRLPGVLDLIASKSSLIDMT